MKYVSILFPRKVVFDNNQFFTNQKEADKPTEPVKIDHDKIKKLNDEKQKKLNDKEIVRK